MDARNLLTITGSNLRLNMKQTLFPAILLLLVLPLIYGTSNLDSIKSADCLERMVALIGIPMFVPLLKPEQEAGMNAIIGLRPFPHRIIVVLRMGLSLICAAALILAFEEYMRMGGCSFPVGFLVSFCWYCVLQAENIGAIFKFVSNGISSYQVLLLLGSSVAIVFFSAG